MKWEMFTCVVKKLHSSSASVMLPNTWSLFFEAGHIDKHPGDLGIY